MSGPPLPDQDHVARYGKPSAMGTDGLPKVAAFELRERDSSLSVNWIEYFGEDRETSLQEIRQVILINPPTQRPLRRSRRCSSKGSGHRRRWQFAGRVLKSA